MNLNLTLIAQALAFASLIWLIAAFIWPPLLNAIEERQKKIAEGLAAADKSQESLAKAEEQVGELLREARGKANQIIDQANVRANQLVLLPKPSANTLKVAVEPEYSREAVEEAAREAADLFRKTFADVVAGEA